MLAIAVQLKGSTQVPTFTSVTDNQGNTWSAHPDGPDTTQLADGYCQMFYALTGPGGKSAPLGGVTTITVQCTLASGNVSLVATPYEFRGFTGPYILHLHGHTAPTATTAYSITGSSDPTIDNELPIAAFMVGSNVTLSNFGSANDSNPAGGATSVLSLSSHSSTTGMGYDLGPINRSAQSKLTCTSGTSAKYVAFFVTIYSRQPQAPTVLGQAVNRAAVI